MKHHPTILYRADGQPLTLGRRIGTGGAGTVFEVKGQPTLVAKRFHEAPRAEQCAKLQLLVTLYDERLSQLTAWPRGLLYHQPNGELVGFLMQRIAHAEELHTLHSPKSRLQKFPEATWAFLLHTAANVARAVATVHEHGLVIGDINPKNILVTRKATVHLLDCDSFQVRLADGKTLRCEQGFAEYTPPELQGIPFRDVDRTAQHDAFGLAVVIFQLLFLGRHPFSGRYLGTDEMSLERAIREQRFAYDEAAASRAMQPPPGTLPFIALPSDLRELFTRALLTAERPQPQEWIGQLEALSQTLQTCAAQSGHRYFAELTACPWCAIEQLTGGQLFYSTGEATSTALTPAIDLPAVWEEIETAYRKLVQAAPPSVNPPTNNALLARDQAALPAYPLQQRLDNFLWSQRKDYLKFLVGTALGGLFAGQYFLFSCFGLPLLFWLLKLVFTNRFQLATQTFGTDVQTLFQNTPSTYLATVPPQDNALKIEAHFLALNQQEETFKQRWRQETGVAPLTSAYESLRTQREEYEELLRLRVTHKAASPISPMTASARQAGLQDWLQTQSLPTAKFERLSEAAQKALRTNQIISAADITPERLATQTRLDNADKQALLNWRSRLERDFATGRVEQPRQTAQELFETKTALETALQAGVATLQQTATQAQKTQQELATHLPQISHQRNLAQVAFERVTKQPPFWPMVLVFIITLFIGPISRIPEIHWETSAPTKPAPILPAYEPKRTNDGMVSHKEQKRALELYSEGLKQSREGRYDRAIPLYFEALAHDPNLALAYEEAAYAQYKLKLYSSAVDSARRALDIDKNSFRAQRTIGLAQVELKDWNAAKEALTKAIRLKDRSVWQYDELEVYPALAIALANLGQLPETLTMLKADIATDPSHILERFQLGAFALQVNDYSLAAEQYVALLRLDATAAESLQTHATKMLGAKASVWSKAVREVARKAKLSGEVSGLKISLEELPR